MRTCIIPVVSVYYTRCTESTERRTVRGGAVGAADFAQHCLTTRFACALDSPDTAFSRAYANRASVRGKWSEGCGHLEVVELGGEGVECIHGLRLETDPLSGVCPQQCVGREAPRRKAEKGIEVVVGIWCLSTAMC